MGGSQSPLTNVLGALGSDGHPGGPSSSPFLLGPSPSANPAGTDPHLSAARMAEGWPSPMAALAALPPPHQIRVFSFKPLQSPTSAPAGFRVLPHCPAPCGTAPGPLAPSRLPPAPSLPAGFPCGGRSPPLPDVSRGPFGVVPCWIGIGSLARPRLLRQPSPSAGASSLAYSPQKNPELSSLIRVLLAERGSAALYLNAMGSHYTPDLRVYKQCANGIGITRNIFQVIPRLGSFHSLSSPPLDQNCIKL